MYYVGCSTNCRFSAGIADCSPLQDVDIKLNNLSEEAEGARVELGRETRGSSYDSGALQLDF